MNKNISNSPQQSSKLFDNPLWSIAKLSEMLSIPEGTIRDWVYKRQIPFKKIGRHVRFEPSEIRRWMDKRSVYGDISQ